MVPGNSNTKEDYPLREQNTARTDRSSGNSSSLKTARLNGVKLPTVCCNSEWKDKVLVCMLDCQEHLNCYLGPEPLGLGLGSPSGAWHRTCADRQSCCSLS